MSVIVQVLNDLAKEKRIDCSVDVCSYLKDFDTLWNINAKSEEILSAQCETIVIIWDGIPDGNTGLVDTTRYLTPIDWAVAVSLAVHRTAPLENNRKKYPNVRILIFDLDSHSISHADSVKLVNQFPKRSIMSMPWVQLFQPLDAEVLIANILGKASADCIVPSMDKFAQKESLDLSVVRNIWAAALTRPTTPGDHHAIANLVGPLLLLDDQEQQDNSHVKALISLLREVGLLSLKDKESDGLSSDSIKQIDALINVLFANPLLNPLLKKDKPWINLSDNEWQIKLQRIFNNEQDSLNLLLVDDQYRQGWGKVLCLAVGADFHEIADGGPLVTIGKGHRTFVKASDSIDWLLDLVEGADEDRRFEFRCDTKANKDCPEILFLDLRLYSGKPLDQEIKFFERISHIANKFIEKKDLPWPTFTREEVERVKTWCEEARKNNGKATREDNVYREALTFLPRILSLTDMSLPIILFSSTGKRDITEKFKDYRNIITAFDKPRFTVDMPEDVAYQTKAKFIEAMTSAMTLLQARCAIKKIPNNAEYPSVNNSGQQNYYVEVFIDESGDGFTGYFTVGGLILVYENEDAALALHKEMETTFVTYKIGIDEITSTLTWCGPNRIDKRLSSDPDERAKIVDQILPFIQKVFLKHAKYVFPLILGTNVSKHHDVDVLHNEHLDNLYLTLFRDIADAAIYEFLTWHVGRDNEIRCQIFAGTRLRPKDKRKSDFTKKEKDILKHNFGITVYKSRSGHDEYKSLTATSFIPMASNLVSGRQNSNMKKLNIEGAVGIALDYETRLDKDVHHAHYVADLMAHFDYISKAEKERDIFKKYFPDRMIDYHNDGFKAAMDASKYIDAKDMVNALLCATYAVANYKPSQNTESIIPKILSRFSQSTFDSNGVRINEFLPALSGKEFKQYSDSLDRWYLSGSNTPSRKALALIQSLSEKQTNIDIVKTRSSNEICAKSSENGSIKAGRINSLSSPEKEIIEVIKKVRSGLECRRSKDGELILVTGKQMSKAMIEFDTVEVGIKLRACTQLTNGILYAKDIEMV